MLDHSALAWTFYHAESGFDYGEKRLMQASKLDLAQHMLPTRHQLHPKPGLNHILHAAPTLVTCIRP
jgi:hypothetical protein